MKPVLRPGVLRPAAALSVKRKTENYNFKFEDFGSFQRGKK